MCFLIHLNSKIEFQKKKNITIFLKTLVGRALDCLRSWAANLNVMAKFYLEKNNYYNSIKNLERGCDR